VQHFRDNCPGELSGTKNSLSRSLKVIKNGMIRKRIYDFLFRSNFGPISYTVFIYRPNEILAKTTNFSYSCVFRDSLKILERKNLR